MMHARGPGSHEETLRALEMCRLPENSNLRIADLGCGTGASTLVLADNLQLQSGVVHLFIAIAAACAEVGKRFAAVKRLMEIVGIAEEPERLAPVQGAADLAAECHEGLSVRGLSFGYPDDGKPVLRNISFDVMPGKSAACGRRPP